MGWQTEIAVQLQAGNTVINQSGTFVYSGPPAAGNLSVSEAPAAGTDQYGNKYLAGVTSYGAGIATQMNQGQIILYTGSLAAGWTSAATIFLSGGVIELICSGGVITSNNTLDNGAGAATFGGALTAGHLSSGGASSTSTNGLANGTINGTSGGASAGTAHTHGGGSYAVASGQHNHTI